MPNNLGPVSLPEQVAAYNKSILPGTGEDYFAIYTKR
jgi:hypothetical protein